MRKVIPLAVVASNLDEILVNHRISNIGDINCAVRMMMKAAIHNYFLSIPNLNELNHFEEAVEMLENRLELVYDEQWYGIIYQHCEKLLERWFKRWDDVTYRFQDQVLSITSHGDYRIKWYHEKHGIGRVGTDMGTPMDSVADVQDPFFVADNIDPTIDRDAYDATKYDFENKLADTPDYLIVRRDDDSRKHHRGRT